MQNLLDDREESALFFYGANPDETGEVIYTAFEEIGLNPDPPEAPEPQRAKPSLRCPREVSVQILLGKGEEAGDSRWRKDKGGEVVHAASKNRDQRCLHHSRRRKRS